jgi:hypothetical protein
LRGIDGIHEKLVEKCATTCLKEKISLEDTDHDSLLCAAWTEFLKEAKLSKEKVVKYANDLTKHGYSFQDLGRINIDLLNRMKIILIGDCVRIVDTAQKVQF